MREGVENSISASRFKNLYIPHFSFNFDLPLPSLTLQIIDPLWDGGDHAIHGLDIPICHRVLPGVFGPIYPGQGGSLFSGPSTNTTGLEWRQQ